MDDHDERWEEVGDEVRFRMSQLAMSQAELARRAGVSDTWLRPLMNGLSGNRRAATLAKVAIALGWTPDSFERMARGEPPQEEANIGLQFAGQPHQDLTFTQAVETVIDHVRKQAGGDAGGEELGGDEVSEVVQPDAVEVGVGH